MDEVLKYIRAEFEWSSDSLWFNPTAGLWTRNNLFYVQETGRFRTYKGYLTERQNLDSYLMVYTRRGQGKLTVNNNEAFLIAGDLFWLDCRVKHIYQTCEEDGWDFDWVHFTGNDINNFHNQFLVGNNNSLVRRGLSSSAIPGLFDKLLNLQTTRGPSQELEASRVIYNMIIETLLLATSQSMPDNKLHSSVVQAIDYMDKNINEKLKLDDIADIINIDKFYLIKLFKKQTGLTPFEWLQRAKISRAKEMLILSDKSVEEIGNIVGYTPASYFISVFRSSEGITPLRFRLRWKNESPLAGSTSFNRL